jgi:hypothetical protein
MFLTLLPAFFPFALRVFEIYSAECGRESALCSLRRSLAETIWPVNLAARHIARGGKNVHP